MKKLIIYIPSYNRSDRLMSQLKVINKEMSSDIKVVISDNNSTDIEGYKNIEKYCIDNNLTYSRNATNSYDLSKAILRPVEQDLKREMSNSIFQKYFLI
jgi:glycosyltransferase involved in cell wall biosynthesis